MELEFLRLKFHHLLSQHLFFFSSSFSLLQPVLLLLLLPLFCFFGSAFSREVFRSGTSSFISSSSSSFISGSSSSSSSSFFFFFYWTWVLNTRVSCGKNISMSAIKTRVFEAWFLHWTRASKAWDVILLNSFQFLLTNNIVWQTHATMQITPTLWVMPWSWI